MDKPQQYKIAKKIITVYWTITIFLAFSKSQNYYLWIGFGLLISAVFLIIKSIMSFRDGYNNKE